MRLESLQYGGYFDYSLTLMSSIGRNQASDTESSIPLAYRRSGRTRSQTRSPVLMNTDDFDVENVKTHTQKHFELP